MLLPLYSQFLLYLGSVPSYEPSYIEALKMWRDIPFANGRRFNGQLNSDSLLLYEVPKGIEVHIYPYGLSFSGEPILSYQDPITFETPYPPIPAHHGPVVNTQEAVNKTVLFLEQLKALRRFS